MANLTMIGCRKQEQARRQKIFNDDVSFLGRLLLQMKVPAYFFSPLHQVDQSHVQSGRRGSVETSPATATAAASWVRDLGLHASSTSA